MVLRSIHEKMLGASENGGQQLWSFFIYSASIKLNPT